MSDPMSPDAPVSPGGARWCELHQRFECTKQSQRTGGPCHAAAIRGTAKCRNHAGKRTEIAKAEGEAVTAWSALNGTPSVDPGRAVLGMLHMSWLRVHLLAGLLEDQVEDEAGDGVPTAAPAAAGESSDDRDAHRVTTPPPGPAAGLIGHTYSGVKDIGIFATGEATRGLAALEAQERDRVVRFAKTAHDMGIAEREIRLAEQQGLLVAGAVRRILEQLGLSEAQWGLVPVVVPQELRAIGEATAVGGGAAA